MLLYDEAQLRLRAETVLAGGAATFSKHWSRYPYGIAPFGIVSGEGTYVTGTNGHTYIDTVGALGPNLLGYGHAAVTEAVTKQARMGASFSAVHPLEIEVAELLCDLIPCAEMVRFGKNGTDATGMAVRLARAVTGHKHMIFVGYSGGANDSYGVTTDKRAGILDEIAPYNHQITWSDIPGLGSLMLPWIQSGGVAGIMAEVPALLWDTTDVHYMEGLRTLSMLAQASGALWILDEVVTYPRYDIHGAQALFETDPDLCTVSKGIANGLPFAALVGKYRHMDRFNTGDIFASWTFAGDAISLAACKATLETCRDTEALRTIRMLGQQFGSCLQEQLQRSQLPAALYGNYARLAVKWHDLPEIATAAELRTLWLQEQAKRGALYGIGVVFPNAAWNRQILGDLLDRSGDVCDMVERAIRDNTVHQHLECPVITDVMSVRL